MEGDKSIIARRDESLSRKVKSHIKTVGRPILKLVLALFSMNPSEAVLAGIDLIDGMNQDGNDPDEHRAFVLLYNGMRRAIVQLVWDHRFEFHSKESTPFPEKDIHALAEELEEVLMEMEIKVDEYFFNHPENLSFLSLLRARFQTWLLDLRVDSKIARRLARKLPLQFTIELESLYSEKEAYFSKVRESVKEKLPISMAKAKHAYNEQLIAEWEKPIFDEPFGMDKLYIELNACCPFKVKDKEGKEITQHQVVRSERHILSWLKEENSKHKIIILRGGPGSGKSSLMKKIVHEVALRGDRDVYAFQLQHFKIKKDLESAIKDYFQRMEVLLHVAPRIFSKVKEGKEKTLLLVFDGLDELSRSGESGEELARQFSSNLSTFLDEKQKWPGWDIRVLITGRDFVIQKISEPIFGEKALVLELLPYSVGEDGQHPFHGIEGLNHNYRFVDSAKLLQADQRAAWWSRFWISQKSNRKDIPSAVQKGEYAQLSRQPLLSYLLARVYVQGGLEEATGASINAVYENLVDSLRTRAWGGGDGHKHTTFEDKERFFRLMEEMAVSAWHYGDVRVSNLKRLEERCEIQGLRPDIEAFKLNVKSSINSLVVSFFAKMHKADSKGGDLIEFTHKSFGEYLVARRIFALAKNVAADLNRQEYSKRTAVDSWISTCSQGIITPEIWAFVENEAQLKPTFENDDTKLDAAQIQSGLVDLFSLMINSGYKFNSGESNLQIIDQTRNAEINLWMMISAFARVSKKPTVIRWKDAEQPRRILGWTWFHPGLWFIRKGFHRVVFPERSNLFRAELREADLSYSDLSSAVLSEADLRAANLFKADLRSSNLHSADLRTADLRSTDLRYGELLAARLSSANLRSADLRSANLCSADFRSADLFQADLSGADLSEADFRSADLRGAVLTEARLDYANLLGANLHLASCYPFRSEESLLDGREAYDFLVSKGARNVPLPPEEIEAPH